MLGISVYKTFFVKPSVEFLMCVDGIGECELPAFFHTAKRLRRYH